jgi:hypothetical protein
MTAPLSQADFAMNQPVAHFGDDARAAFAAAYPNQPTTFAHGLGDHPLLTLEALAALGEALPDRQLEYNRSDVPVGTQPDEAPKNGLSIGDTIRTIAENQSWCVLKNIETMPAYDQLLRDLLGELRDVVLPRTGEMLTLQGFIFVSSPGSVTPYHFDPEHNILLQLQGSKTMHAFPAGDLRFAAQVQHERYHTGSHRGLPWDDSFAGSEFVADLQPGRAVLMPVMAPHFVRVGSDPSISLSITWRSEWSYREADAHAANNWLRQRSFSPAMPPRWPDSAHAKVFAWRVARKLGLVGKA